MVLHSKKAPEKSFKAVGSEDNGKERFGKNYGKNGEKMSQKSYSMAPKGNSLADNLSRSLWAFEFVKVYKKDKSVFEGRLVKDDKKEISLKLKSGYNIVILKENIESIEKITDSKYLGSESKLGTNESEDSKNKKDIKKEERKSNEKKSYDKQREAKSEITKEQKESDDKKIYDTQGKAKKTNVAVIKSEKSGKERNAVNVVNGEKSGKRSKLPKIIILHTGGTIASKVDYDIGGVSAFFEPEEIVSLFPELKEIAEIETKKVSNVFSDELRFEDYNVMCENIVKTANEGCKGIIITHGTDTMHYTSCALSFMLKGLNIPVVIVGAQRSSDRSSSDSGINLISASRFAVKPDIKGVFICMHEKSSDDSCVILKGLNVRKMHTSRRDAFRQINSKPFARVKRNGDVEVLDKEYVKDISRLSESNGNVKKTERNIDTSFNAINPNLKIAMVYVHPSMNLEEISYIKNLDGAILIGTGLGHIGTTGKNKEIFEELRDAINRGCVVAVCPQTIYGRVNFNVYSNGVKLKEIGCLGNLCDMTPETGFIKLAYLLSNYEKAQAKGLYEKNLCGELNLRIGYKEDFEEQ